MQLHRLTPIRDLQPEKKRRPLNKRSISILAALGLSAGIAASLHVCFKKMGPGWNSRAPLCDGPRVYRIRKGHDDMQHGFQPEQTIQVKKGGVFTLDGIDYSVIGHVPREGGGELIVQEVDTEVLEIIRTHEGKGKLAGRLRFDGWLCEKPAKIESE